MQKIENEPKIGIFAHCGLTKLLFEPEVDRIAIFLGANRVNVTIVLVRVD